jgi:type III secretion system low calcium response chaperone LcrH/SycD
METTPTVSDIYQMAYHLYQGGRYADAEGCFRLLTTLDIRNIHHWMGLGAALQKQLRFVDAADAYGVAATFEDTETNPFPHLYAAECLFAAGDMHRAQQALISAQKIAVRDKEYDQLSKQIHVLKERWESLCQVT